MCALGLYLSASIRVQGIYPPVIDAERLAEVVQVCRLIGGHLVVGVSFAIRLFVLEWMKLYLYHQTTMKNSCQMSSLNNKMTEVYSTQVDLYRKEKRICFVRVSRLVTWGWQTITGSFLFQ